MAELSLQALRAQGADRHDPIRFRYLEALERRMASQAPAVQQRLQQRLQAAMAQYAQTGSMATVQTEKTALSPSPLRLLLLIKELDARRQPPGAAPVSGPELHSVQRFRATWFKVAAERQVAQALAQAPQNAGPLNSQRLMLRALRLMHRLSPDYLHHFMASADTLLWLDGRIARMPRTVVKSTRMPRRKA